MVGSGQDRSLESPVWAWLPAGATRSVCGVLLFCGLVALGAQVRIALPGTPVPMTLQLPVVLLAGFCLPVSAAMASMLLYLSLGVAGGGVFAPGSAGLAGVTGGYLVGFILGAGAVSLTAGRGVSWARLLPAGMVGVAVIFLCGVWWQAVWLQLDWRDALGVGLVPFVPKTIMELGLAVSAAGLLRSAKHPARRGDV